MTQELYALGKDRSATFVRGFLEHFLPNREPSCCDYPVPESSNVPVCVLKTECEILDHMERHPHEPSGLYWNAHGNVTAQAMVFYTRDAHVIFGLAVEASELRKKLKELTDFVGATYATLGSEQRPPDTVKEFVALCLE